MNELHVKDLKKKRAKVIGIYKSIGYQFLTGQNFTTFYRRLLKSGIWWADTDQTLAQMNYFQVWNAVHFLGFRWQSFRFLLAKTAQNWVENWFSVVTFFCPKWFLLKKKTHLIKGSFFTVLLTFVTQIVIWFGLFTSFLLWRLMQMFAYSSLHCVFFIIIENGVRE